MRVAEIVRRKGKDRTGPALDAYRDVGQRGQTARYRSHNGVLDGRSARTNAVERRTTRKGRDCILLMCAAVKSIEMGIISPSIQPERQDSLSI